jgi:hypothetical protein
VTGYQRIAIMLEALAGWLDEELAGGVPPKYLVQQASAAARHVAGIARTEGKTAL